MAFKDDLLTILSGGLPALVDGPAPAPTPAETNNLGEPQTVEQTPPEPQLQDTEPFAVAGLSGQKLYLAGGAALLAVLALVYVLKK